MIPTIPAQHSDLSCAGTAEKLPRWDLTDFYQSFTDPALSGDLEKIETLTATFVQKYQNFLRSSDIDAEGLAQAIVDYETLQELMGKIMSYAYLAYAVNQNDPKVLQFFQKMQEKITTLSTPLIFFTLDLNSIEESHIEVLLASSPRLSHYRPWINSVRLFRPHQLDPALEQLLHEKSVSGRSAWVRLYDETLAQMTFPWIEEPQEAKVLTLTELLEFMCHPSAALRQQAAEALNKEITAILPLFSLVFNTLAKDKDTEDTWRKYPHPMAERNLSNQVEDSVVDTLFNTTKRWYPRLSHRYYALKAKWLGVEKLEYWDRNAPLPEVPSDTFSWAEAKDIVLQAYEGFSPEMARIGRQFFEKCWIDAACEKGKTSGAFAHPTVPSIHPYILMSYQGKPRDVSTLAHELGHGIHQCLSASQGPLMADTPLTIAETASVFGEMLVFQELLSKTTDPLKKRSLLAAKVEDMLNTVVRQIAFCDFEKQFHQRRKQGELLPEEIAELFVKTQGQALGPCVNMSPTVQYFWAYISHFIHAPFYVYAYAFGDCLVNSLYALFEGGHPDFQAKYLELLKAGGSKRYPELLAPFGLEASTESFWEEGLKMIDRFITELEKL